MPKFRVGVREVHVQGYIVEADTGQEAIEKIASGDYTGFLRDRYIDEGDFVFSHTMEPETWSVKREQ